MRRLRLLGVAGVFFSAVALTLFASSSAQALIITASGTITDQPYGPDANGLFGPVGASLIGDQYTETIATIPALNAYTTSPSPSYQLSTYGGAAYGANAAGTAAPYIIAVTVNGVIFTQIELNPFQNLSFLANGLTTNQGIPQMDSAVQVVQSAGCFSAYPSCTNSYIAAYSLSTPFIPKLSFNQSLTISNGLDPGSNTYFNFRSATTPGLPEAYTFFYGSIDTLSINSVAATPLPPAWTMMLIGLAGFGFVAYRRKNGAALAV
jgi:hypothetical protein